MYADKFTHIFLITHLYQPWKNLFPTQSLLSEENVKVNQKRKALLRGCIDFHRISDMFLVTLIVLKKPEIIFPLAIEDDGPNLQNMIPLSFL